MSSEIKADKWSPASGTSATIGDSGDTYTVPSGVTLNTSSATLTLPSTVITGQTEKTSLVDADKFLISDSAASGALKYVQNSNLGGDIVKLGSLSNYSSTVSAIDVDLFSTSYKYYRFIATLRAESAGADLRFRWRTGGAEQAGSYYIYGSHRVQINSGGTVTTGNLFSGFYTDHAQIANNMTASNNHDTLIDWTFYDPMRITLAKPYVQGLVQSYREDDIFRQSYFGCKYNSASISYNGFRIYLSTGNLEDFQYVMYGVKE